MRDEAPSTLLTIRFVMLDAAHIIIARPHHHLRGRVRRRIAHTLLQFPEVFRSDFRFPLAYRH